MGTLALKMPIYYLTLSVYSRTLLDEFGHQGHCKKLSLGRPSSLILFFDALFIFSDIVYFLFQLTMRVSLCLQALWLATPFPLALATTAGSFADGGLTQVSAMMVCLLNCFRGFS